MCGIAGILTLDESEAPRDAVQHMMAALEHRGPDDSGQWGEGPCALGHRRLTIIDLSEQGRQPLSNEDGTVWLTYNGECYNYQPLRERLLADGHRFRSHTDSEVLVHLYESTGGEVTPLLEQLDGMFAFGLWDANRARLLLARDRLGIKPLYWAISGGNGAAKLLLFASEIKALLASGFVSPQPSLEGIASYLTFRHAVPPGTMFEGVHTLPPGHVLVAEDGDIHVQRYWDLPIPERREDRGETYYRERVRELLTGAVRKRLMSDVPLGAYLSGGLDSSIIVALMAQELGDRLKTYSVGFGDETVDEFQYARLVADRYATDHTEVRLDHDHYFELLPELIEKRDAPLGVPNEVPLYHMSKVLKQEITVVLSGEGADEIFGGYGDYVRIPFDYQKARALRSLPGVLRRPLMGGMEAKYGGSVDCHDPVDHFFAGYRWFAPHERAELLTAEASERAGSGGRDAFESHFRSVEQRPYYDQVLYVLEQVHLVNLLGRVDAMTMATAVEARVPFVDHELVEFVTAMPLRYKLRWRSPLHRARALFSYSDVFRERDDTTKFILRRAFADLVPAEILQRRKVGFKVPLERWLGGELMSYARELLLSDEARRRGIFDVDAVERWLGRGAANGGEFGHRVWMLINLELWFRLYFADGATLGYPAPALVAS